MLRQRLVGMFVLSVALCLRFTACAATGAEPACPRDGFKPLFNGKDLTGWKADEEAKKHWAATERVIRYDGKNRDLWTEQSFGDFILKVEWRMPAPGDSGIFLRGFPNAQVNIWCNEMGSGEVWGYRTDAKQPEEVRKAATPKKRADKPVGEWNTFVIIMQGERLTVVLNGQQVISNARLPGVPKSGPIGLQHHGTPLEFRNISIKELQRAGGLCGQMPLVPTESLPVTVHE